MENLVKIYFPKHLFVTKRPCKLFGEIEEKNNIYLFYILDTNDSQLKTLKLIGNVGSSDISDNDDDDHQSEDNFLEFVYSNDLPNLLIKNIRIVNRDGVIINRMKIHLILYDYNRFDCLSKNDFSYYNADECSNNEIIHLATTIKQKNDDNKYRNKRLLISNEKTIELWNIITRISAWFSFLFKPIERFFKDTAILYHFSDWKNCIRTYDFAR